MARRVLKTVLDFDFDFVHVQNKVPLQHAKEGMCDSLCSRSSPITLFFNHLGVSLQFRVYETHITSDVRLALYR